MSLSIVIPVRNKEKIINTILNELVRPLKEKQIEYEVILIDDYSSDQTDLPLV